MLFCESIEANEMLGSRQALCGASVGKPFENAIQVFHVRHVATPLGDVDSARMQQLDAQVSSLDFGLALCALGPVARRLADLPVSWFIAFLVLEFRPTWVRIQRIEILLGQAQDGFGFIVAKMPPANERFEILVCVILPMFFGRLRSGVALQPCRAALQPKYHRG